MDFLPDFFLYVSAGAMVGLAVGVTGVGGGSLMTPLLLALGFPLRTAVGTDLLYAAITKTGGAITHGLQKTIRWDLVLRLALGSIPASLVCIYVLNHWFDSPDQYTGVISVTLGVTLILTSVAIIFRSTLAEAVSHGFSQDGSQAHWLTPIAGILIGILVTLSSVGAGAIATAMLMIFYPYLKSIKIVGTDIAHAVPLTLVAGLGHLWLGNVNLELLFALIIGSLPAVYVGAKVGQHIPDKIMRPLLATMLFGVGIKVAFF